MKLAQEHPGSVASTNAKAELGIKLTIWSGIVSGLGFLYCVAVGRDSLADNILWAWLLFLASYLGINAFQRKVDRQTDYGALERMNNGQSVVTKETTKTRTQETATKETVTPPKKVPGAVPTDEDFEDEALEGEVKP